MTIIPFLGSSGYPPLPGPQTFTTPGSSTVTIPFGASSVAVICAGPSGKGGDGASGSLDHGGGGGGTGGVALRTIALTSADWGLTISYTVGQSRVSASAVVYGAFTLIGGFANDGNNATPTTNGIGGTGASASGGTTNTTGNTGSNGTNGGGGAGASAPASGVGPGGTGGYGSGSFGTAGVNGSITFTWS